MMWSCGRAGGSGGGGGVAAMWVMLVALVLLALVCGSSLPRGVAAQGSASARGNMKNILLPDTLVRLRASPTRLEFVEEPLVIRNPWNAWTSLRLLASDIVVQAGTAKGNCSIHVEGRDSISRPGAVEVTISPFWKATIEVRDADYIATRTQVMTWRLVLLICGLALILNARRLSQDILVYYSVMSVAVAFVALALLFITARKLLGNRVASAFGGLSALVGFVALRLGISTEHFYWGYVMDTFINTVTFQEGYEGMAMALVATLLISVVVTAYFGPPSQNVSNSLCAFLMVCGSVMVTLAISDTTLGALLAAVIAALIFRANAQDAHEEELQRERVGVAAAAGSHQDSVAGLTSPRPGSPAPGSPVPRRSLVNGFGSAPHSPNTHRQQQQLPQGQQQQQPLPRRPQQQQQQQHHYGFATPTAPPMNQVGQRLHELKCEHLRRDISGSPNKVLRKLERQLPRQMRGSFASFYAEGAVLSPQDYEVVSNTYEQIEDNFDR